MTQYSSRDPRNRLHPSCARFTLLVTPQAPYTTAGASAPPPWQPLDPIAAEWAVLVLTARSAAAYTAAGRAVLALSWEESARVHHAAACGMMDQGSNEACRVQLEQVLRDLSESWREWRSTVSWMQSNHIQLRPAEEREHRHLPNAGLSSAELLATFEQSARSQQVRLEMLPL